MGILQNNEFLWNLVIRMTVDQQAAACQPFPFVDRLQAPIGRQLTDKRPTDFLASCSSIFPETEWIKFQASSPSIMHLNGTWFAQFPNPNH